VSASHYEEKKTEPTCSALAEAFGEWPNCATPDCENKACLSLNSAYCYPCTRLRDGLTWAQVKAEQEENRRSGNLTTSNPDGG
jgi:hypothetical protein